MLDVLDVLIIVIVLGLVSVILYGAINKGASEYVLSKNIEEYGPNPGAFPDIRVSAGIYDVRPEGAI